jgi:hypothetical protein
MKPVIAEVRLSEIVFDEVVYPRKEHDPALVQRYAGVLDEIEAKGSYIAVASDNKMLDGKHRWLAYRKVYDGKADPKIKVFRYAVSTPHEQLKLSAKLNSEHGWQLSEEDKKFTAISLHGYGCTYEDIAETLSVGKAKVSEWLARTVKEEKDRRDRKIFELWLACWSRDEIANSAVSSEWFSGTKMTKSDKSAAEHSTDFKVPIYNVWKQQEKTKGVEHFGNSEITLLDNLLYLYTEPFDVVIDPFAGGGSTIDLCRKRFRRYFVSDRLPIVERETEIRKHDLVKDKFLKPPQWKDVKLVYLDPPYWKQAEGQYSQDKSDLANMELKDFTRSLATIIKKFASKIPSKSFIALLMQPTQWKAPNKAYTDHVAHVLRDVKLPIRMRVSCPYESQQCTAQMVEWAQKNKEILVLTRELIIWGKG